MRSPVFFRSSGCDKSSEPVGAGSEVLTIGEVAQRWRVSVRTARRMVGRLRVPRMVLGHRTVRYRLEDLILAEGRVRG